jgi:hypothetical protein
MYCVALAGVLTTAVLGKRLKVLRSWSSRRTNWLTRPPLLEEGQAPRPGGDQSRTRCRARVFYRSCTVLPLVYSTV